MRNPHPNGCQDTRAVCRHPFIHLYTSVPLVAVLPGVQLRLVRSNSEGWWLWAYSPTHAALNLRRKATHPERLHFNTKVRSRLCPAQMLNQEQIGIFLDAVILEGPLPQLPLLHEPEAPPPLPVFATPALTCERRSAWRPGRLCIVRPETGKRS